MSLDRFCRSELENFVVEGNGTSTNVRYEQCNTFEKILAWTDYFLTQPAYEAPVIKRFIKLACKKHGLELVLK